MPVAVFVLKLATSKANPEYPDGGLRPKKNLCETNMIFRFNSTGNRLFNSNLLDIYYRGALAACEQYFDNYFMYIDLFPRCYYSIVNRGYQ